MTEKTVKNTFAPNCGNKTFTANQLLGGLRFGGFRYKDLPKEAQDLVDTVMPTEPGIKLPLTPES